MLIAFTILKVHLKISQRKLSIFQKSKASEIYKARELLIEEKSEANDLKEEIPTYKIVDDENPSEDLNEDENAVDSVKFLEFQK